MYVCVCSLKCHYIWKSEGYSENLFSPSALGVLGTKLSSLDLAASLSFCRASLLVLLVYFLRQDLV